MALRARQCPWRTTSTCGPPPPSRPSLDPAGDHGDGVRQLAGERQSRVGLGGEVDNRVCTAGGFCGARLTREQLGHLIPGEPEGVGDLALAEPEVAQRLQGIT